MGWDKTPGLGANESSTSSASELSNRSTSAHVAKFGAGEHHARQPWELRVDRRYNEKILRKVNDIVTNNLYREDLSKTVWPKALEAHRNEILQSKTLLDLFRSMNAAIAELQSSHCEFLTSNDEIFYFLHDHFGRFRSELRLKKNDFVGFVTGPPRFAFNQVRYVLDGSPAAKSGIQSGDLIISINEQPYFGQINLLNKANKNIAVVVERDGKRLNLTVPVVKIDQYEAYIEAMKKGVTTFEVDKYKLGYVHVWCGGGAFHDAFGEAMSKVHDTDGLILDLRDGYGAIGSESLGVFFCPSAAFPPITMQERNGKTHHEYYSYDKPLVVLINDGARSGKELLANALKVSRRATLLGIPTAGAVLAGKLFSVDKRCALYLAVEDVAIGNERLEGHGVTPDIVIGDRLCESGRREQLEKAKAVIVDLIKQGGSHQSAGNGIWQR
jgi:carboxyl-terminal processing protease